MLEFNKHANVIYKDAGEKNVAAVVLYPNESDVLHWDEAFEAPVLPTELYDLCMKNLALVATEDGFAKVTAFKVATSDDVAISVTANAKAYSSGTKTK